jgi:hypothetical protein
MTNTTNVLARACEKNIGAAIHLLRTSLETPALLGESSEVNIDGNRDKKIYVLRIGFFGADGTYQADANNAANTAHRPRELQSSDEQLCATRAFRILHHHTT